MLYGYCRVSSKEQNLDRQIECIKSKYPSIQQSNIYSDKQSGKDFNRPAYLKMKSILINGDELIIKELDRLGRNKDAIKEELKYFKENNITVRILDIPTTLIDYGNQVWVSEMITNILVEVLGSMAEQERIKIKSRQKEGIECAKEKGVKFGRPLVDRELFQKALADTRQGVCDVKTAIQSLGINKSTWYRLVNEGV